MGGRVAVLAGAARRAAASFGSLLIAAVPSSPSRADDDVNRGPDKPPRGACQRVKRDVGRGQQESRRRARPRRSLRASGSTMALDARRADLPRILERQDDSSRRPVQLAILVCHALSEISQTTPFDFTAAKLSVYATPSYLLAHTCSLVVGHTARATGRETTP